MWGSLPMDLLEDFETKKTHIFKHIHTQNKTKQRGFSPNQLTTQLNTMTLSNGGLRDALVLLHEQHGGRWQENYENQYL